jgi:hypothetical protein
MLPCASLRTHVALHQGDVLGSIEIPVGRCARE